MKQKQKGAEHLELPSVEGHEGGKWIVIDSGMFIQFSETMYFSRSFFQMLVLNKCCLCKHNVFFIVGTIIVHALEEKARTYYDLESLWTTEVSPKGPNQVGDMLQLFDSLSMICCILNS